MEFIDTILAHYGAEGVALAAVILGTLGVQLYYYLVAYGRIATYKNARRRERLAEPPAVSVIVTMFSENYDYVEQTLPLIVAQEYPDFEVVVVYVGHDKDFFDELLRLRQSFPQINATKIEMNPRFPISIKQALNVGIKSAHYEHLLFTTTDARPVSNRWLSLMARGFLRGELVVGYCGMEQRPGFAGRFMQIRRMMGAVDWLAWAVAGRAHRAMRQNFGFTKSLYFAANGFDHLNMNVGEDDLFFERLVTPENNVSVILSPRATLRERAWGGFGWWLSQERLFRATRPFYPRAVRNATAWELGSRTLFLLAVLCALVVMPWEYKVAAAVILLVRLAAVLFAVRRIARRLGERGLWLRYPLYDLLSPLYEGLMCLVEVRKDDRVWR